MNLALRSNPRHASHYQMCMQKIQFRSRKLRLRLFVPRVHPLRPRLLPPACPSLSPVPTSQHPTPPFQSTALCTIGEQNGSKICKEERKKHFDSFPKSKTETRNKTCHRETSFALVTLRLAVALQSLKNGPTHARIQSIQLPAPSQDATCICSSARGLFRAMSNRRARPADQMRRRGLASEERVPRMR